MHWLKELPAPVREFVISIVAFYIFILFCTWGEGYRIWEWEIINRFGFAVVVLAWPVIASCVRYDKTKRFW